MNKKTNSQHSPSDSQKTENATKNAKSKNANQTSVKKTETKQTQTEQSPPIEEKQRNADESWLTKIRMLFFGQEDYLERILDCGINVVVVASDAMSDSKKIAEFVLNPLVFCNVKKPKDIFARLCSGSNAHECSSFSMVVSDYLNGYCIVFVGEKCFAVDARTTLGRSIAEPPTSMVMRGPREGFVEDVKVNVTLLKKRLKTECFKTISVSVGQYTNTSVCVCYLDGIADKSVVDSVVQRLKNVKIDGVLDASYLARYLDTDRTRLFRRVGMTEKPDVAVGKMLEGRIAVIADGSPMVLTLPYLYIEDLQSPGDYYENASMISLNRILRFISVLASLLLPSLYVCLQMFNYQIIPLKFLITVLNATEAIPFSPLVEMVLVIVIFDILREANLRMPSAVGISLSLVGAIVLGDAAVKAGLIGAPAVMIGALSGIGLFTMPDNTLILSLLRVVITLVGGFMGIFGVLLAMLAITVYLCSLQSYKTPFLAPYAPAVPHDKQDAVLESPLQNQVERPKSIPNVNKVRRGK